MQLKVIIYDGQRPREFPPLISVSKYFFALVLSMLMKFYIGNPGFINE